MAKHFEDLTAIDVPLGELDEETQNRLFQAFLGGDAIERKIYPQPSWDSAYCPTWKITASYRVKPKPMIKPSINWSHVAKEYRWLALDATGNANIYQSKPFIATGDAFLVCHGVMVSRADAFSSYTAGTCDWRDSLVERPAGQ